MITKEEFLSVIEKNVLSNTKLSTELSNLRRLYQISMGVFIVACVGAVVLSAVKASLFFDVLVCFALFCSFLALFKIFTRIQVVRKTIFFEALSCFGLTFSGEAIDEEFIKKTRLFGFQKMKSDELFKGVCRDKEFFVSELSCAKNQWGKVVLISIPYSHATTQTLIFNSSRIFKPFVAGFEKVDAFFSHSWFDENLVFSKNKLETGMLVTYNFVDRMQKIKELFPNTIDITTVDGQLLLAIHVGYSVYDMKRAAPLKDKLSFDLIYDELFGEAYYHNLYDNVSKIFKVVDILMK